MSKVLSARVKDDIYDRLANVAEKRGLKLNDLVQEALNFYLENYAGYALALERLNNQNDPFIEGETFTERLGWD